MWKLIKWIFFLAVVLAIVLYFLDVKLGNKSFRQYVREIKGSEEVKDIRSIVGEALKALGDQISGDVTDKERKELEDIIKSKRLSYPAIFPTSDDDGWTMDCEWDTGIPD